MQRFIKSLVLTLLLLFFGIPEMTGGSNQAIADSLMNQLKFQKSADDSLKMLYNIFDATDYQKKVKPGMMVLDLARRSDNQLALMDFIPQVTSLVSKDSAAMKTMLEYTDYLKDEETRKTIRLFVLVKKAAEEANYIPEDKQREVLLKYAREDMTAKGDMYEDILDLYRMVIFLGNYDKGNLYLEYLTRLEKMLDEVAPEFGYIHNLYYTTAANCHTRNDNPAKAIEVDKKLLETIALLEKRYKDMGRIYRDYTRYYYICYRRMLGNYKALTMDEIKDIYAKCALLAANNSEIAADFYGEGRPTIYRLMAQGDYKGAVPKIKKALPLVRDNYTRRRLLSMLVAASDSINDNATLLTALKDYNQLLKTTIEEQSVSAYEELQIRYDLNQLKADKQELEMEKKEVEVATGQRVITVALSALLIFAVLLMFLFRSNFKLKQRVKEMKSQNVNLHKYIEESFDEASNLPGTLDVRQDNKK